MAVGDLVVNLMARTERFTRPLQQAQKGVSGFVSSTLGGFARIGQASIGVVASFRAFEGLLFPVKLAADAEQTAIAFEVLTGSADTAGRLVRDLRTMGAKTPFEFTDLSEATRVLLSFGRTAGDVMDDLDMLSNVAAGDAQKLSSLALVFGQIAANGRLTGGDLLQLVNAGFNPLQQIAERTGESMTELRDRMSKGQIGFEEVRQAFADATSEGGRFFQMNEKQSQTLLGRWSTLKDEVTQALMEVGVAISEEFDLTGAIANVTDMVSTFKKDWGPAVVEGIKKAAEFGRTLFDWFVKIRDFVSELIGKIREFVDAVDELALRAAAAVQGVNPDEIIRRRKTLAGMTEDAGGIDDTLGKLIDSTQAMHDAVKPANLDPIERIAGKDFKIDLVMTPDDLEKFTPKTGEERQSLLSELEKSVQERNLNRGKSIQQREQDRSIGSLEQGSREAFEVLRANVGGRKEDQQLKVAQKSEKHLEKIAKGIQDMKSSKGNPEVVVMGLD